MFKLDKRQQVREHRKAVNAGEAVDPVIQYGTDENGAIIGDDGKTPVDGTAPGGFDKGAVKTETEENKPFDYGTLGTHSDLDGEKGLNGREKPEGWDTKKVVEKQAWLADNRPATNETTAPATNGNGW